MPSLVAWTAAAGWAALLALYAVVLGDVCGGFALPTSAPSSSSSYLASPYWMGVPVAVRKPLAALQAVALAGYVGWVAWLAHDPPAAGPLATTPRLLHGLHAGFFGASAAWPVFVYLALRHDVQRPAAAFVWSACAALWATALCVVGLVVGTLEARYASPVPGLALAPLLLLTAVADGVLWTACALRTLAPSPRPR